MPKVRAIHVPVDPEMPISTVEVETHYPGLNEVLGGWIEVVRTYATRDQPPHPCVMVVDEEGLLKELPLNIRASYLYNPMYFMGRGTPIVGEAYLFEEAVIEGEPELINISDETFEYFRNYFREGRDEGRD